MSSEIGRSLIRAASTSKKEQQSVERLLVNQEKMFSCRNWRNATQSLEESDGMLNFTTVEFDYDLYISNSGDFDSEVIKVQNLILFGVAEQLFSDCPRGVEENIRRTSDDFIVYEKVWSEPSDTVNEFGECSYKLEKTSCYPMNGAVTIFYRSESPLNTTLHASLDIATGINDIIRKKMDSNEIDSDWSTVRFVGARGDANTKYLGLDNIYQPWQFFVGNQSPIVWIVGVSVAVIAAIGIYNRVKTDFVETVVVDDVRYYDDEQEPERFEAKQTIQEKDDSDIDSDCSSIVPKWTGLDHFLPPRKQRL